jgi:translation initiation factor 1
MTRRVVYSTERGRLCPGCGWPEKDCRCSSARPVPREPVPEKIVARLRLESRAAGKNVTVIDGLPKNSAFLDALAKELKKSCGTGGQASEDAVQLQGDQRERLRDLLAGKGWAVKG